MQISWQLITDGRVWLDSEDIRGVSDMQEYSSDGEKRYKITLVLSGGAQVALQYETHSQAYIARVDAILCMAMRISPHPSIVAKQLVDEAVEKGVNRDVITGHLADTFSLLIK